MDVEEFPKLSFKNGKTLLEQAKCSCYFCFKTFETMAVKDFAQEQDAEKTALCPYCWMDTLVPGEVAEEFLVAAHKRWFGRKVLKRDE